MSNFPPAVSESTAQMILEAILLASFAGTIVYVVAWCLSFLSRDRIKPGLLKLIWLLVLVRFVVFFRAREPFEYPESVESKIQTDDASCRCRTDS